MNYSTWFILEDIYYYHPTDKVYKTEAWKSIIGFDDYLISNLGRVKSLKFGKERILRPSKNNNGYLSVVLSVNCNCKTKLIHQLVAIEFLGHIPNGKKSVVNHKDFDKLNNCYYNFEIVTFRENTNKKHLKSSSKYTGVTWHKQRSKWVSTIVINGNNKYLGLFINEIDASNAYQKALNELNQCEIKP